MIFYDCATAPSPRRARILIAEKGLDIETREVSIADGAHLQPEFLRVNPRGTVPVLVTDDGVALTENLGIAAYLEARCPEPPLMGTTPEEKGLVLMWNALVEQQGGQPIAEALRNSSPALAGRALPGPVEFEQIPALAERGRRRVALFWDLLEARLRESRYLAGDSFTLPDITAFVFVEFARVIRATIPEGHTATQEWYARVRARPAAAL
ncbi:glutathione S-transferase [Cribrihabitans marinus]|uniref:Glutathione S-transferase n=1 Tax=Cribrihabitans marinus TaxID=1227549 RepID=A0A1H6SMK9_9RHOB|nr:glutathione S-transferase [Cribrihabitans marinus]GGH23655.1 glutathione S-transferase [Cribrihabitans marinus]SEI65220.1 glutathione S-transferase [Cribrihabitans marinus]